MNYLILALCLEVYWEIISLNRTGLKTCNEKEEDPVLEGRRKRQSKKSLFNKKKKSKVLLQNANHYEC